MVTQTQTIYMLKNLLAWLKVSLWCPIKNVKSFLFSEPSNTWLTETSLLQTECLFLFHTHNLLTFLFT